MSNSVSSVTVVINGQTITLSPVSGQAGTWSATAVAPAASSRNQANGYYPVSVTATYNTGTTTTVDDTHATLGSSCRLVVKEKVAPTITISKPAATNGAHLKVASQELEATIVDNANGQSSGYSGVDLSTLSMVVSSVKLSTSYTIPSSSITSTAVTGGYKVSANYSFADSDDWVLTVNCSDYDGNAAAAATRSFEIDTDAPLLSLSAPADDLHTASASVTVSGTTSDTGAGPVTVAISVDGTAYSTPTVTSGAFSDTVVLTSTGSHTITVTATDAAGNTTSISKTVWYSDAAPTITSVTLVPNPADGGATYTITVEVS